MAEVVSLRKDEVRGLVLREEASAGVVRLTLNNPPANALSVALMEALIAELDMIAASADVRVVVLAASGKLFRPGTISRN